MSTEIKCNICEHKIKFDIEDEKTFINKTEKGTFYGTEISVYRVAHQIESKNHINAVIVDKKGNYRGFVDSYMESLDTGDKQYQILGKDTSDLQLHQNKMFGPFVFINTKTKEAVNSFTDENLKIVELVEVLEQRVDEALKIYKRPPEFLKLAIADKRFLVWTKEHIIIGLSIKKFFKEKSLNMNKLIQFIFSFLLSHDMPSVNIRNFAIVIKIIERFEITFDDDDVQYLHRLVSDDSLNFMFNVNVELADIIKFVNNTFSIDTNVLLQLFQGEASILDLLLADEDNLKIYKDLIKMMDFLNRRNIINVLDT